MNRTKVKIETLVSVLHKKPRFQAEAFSSPAKVSLDTTQVTIFKGPKTKSTGKVQRFLPTGISPIQIQNFMQKMTNIMAYQPPDLLLPNGKMRRR